MMNNYLKLLCLSSAFLLTPANSAEHKTIDACETKLKSEESISQCFDGIRDRKDRELQTWINNQTFILEELAQNTGRRAALNMFKRAQRNFNTYRENNCRWHYLAISPNPGASNAFKKCYIRITQNRINELGNTNK